MFVTAPTRAEFQLKVMPVSPSSQKPIFGYRPDVQPEALILLA